MEILRLDNDTNNLTSQNNNPERPGRTASIIAVVIFIIVVTLIIGISFHRVFMAPWRHTILRVGDVTFTMRDFIKRLRLKPLGTGASQLQVATNVLQEIKNLELIRQEALRRNIKISEEELEYEIRRRVQASTTGEGEFKDLYAAMLRGLRLKEKEYRTWVKLDIYRRKLFQVFVKKIPEVAEHVHIYAIVASTAKKAEELRARLKKGEGFEKLAKEESIDLASAKRGGDLGWMPKGVDALETPDQIHAMGILTKTKEEAEQIREKILAGDDFKTLASLNSHDDQSREKGGYLGWISTDYRTGKQYAAEAYELKPGELSQPIKTYEGFWVVKLIEKLPEGKVIDDVAFDQPEGQVSPPLNTMRGFYLIKVAAKRNRLPLSREHRAILANQKLDQWLAETSTKGSKEGWLKWDWRSETYSWAIDHLD